MSFWLSVIARWVHNVALSLWLGGLIAIGALVAPTAFHVARTTAALASDPRLQSEMAGAVVGGSLRKFNILCIVCAVLMLLADIAFARLGADRRTRRLTWISAAATFILLALTVYLKQGLFPALDLAQAQHQWPLFDHLHHLYEGLSRLQMPLLLVVAWVVALRDTARTLPASSHTSI